MREQARRAGDSRKVHGKKVMNVWKRDGTVDDMDRMVQLKNSAARVGVFVEFTSALDLPRSVLGREKRRFFDDNDFVRWGRRALAIIMMV